MCFRTRPLVDSFGSRGIGSVKTEEIEAWLADRPGGAQSMENYRRVIGQVWNFAMKRGMCSRNPVDAIEKVAIDEKMPEHLPVAKVEKLLRSAQKLHPDMIPHLAIGIFAGLRPVNELRGVQWGDINLDDNLLLVRPNTAKKRRSRLVEIAPNLRAWLKRCQKKRGALAYSAKKIAEIRKDAGIKWNPDVMRHTYATYHLAKWNDAAKTALQLGHTRGVEVLFNHYRGLAKTAEAEKFWSIMP
jgi:integrase